MEVIPGINCSSLECIKERFQKIKEFGSFWAQLDVSDGKFTPNKNWFEPEDIAEIIVNFPEIKVELHFMVENPDAIIGDWLKIGVKRIIVHIETAKDVSSIKELCEKYNVELMLAVAPHTPAENLIPYLNAVRYVQILAVNPGLSGQKFHNITDEIRLLKTKAPQIKIEIDGGITPETAKLVKQAGADIVAATSYIFGSPNPQKAYEELRSI